jgi:hypothetical protein
MKLLAPYCLLHLMTAACVRSSRKTLNGYELWYYNNDILFLFFQTPMLIYICEPIECLLAVYAPVAVGLRDSNRRVRCQ